MKCEHNQVIKFQKKWGIQKQDEHDIYEPKMKEKEDFEGEQELEQAGRIEEAAAVFSKEGMGFFANLMRDTMREEIEKVLPQVAQEMKPLIREMVQREIETAFLAMIQGLRSGLPHVEEKPNIEVQPELVQDEPVTAGTPEPAQEPAPLQRNRNQKQKRHKRSFRICSARRDRRNMTGNRSPRRWRSFSRNTAIPFSECCRAHHPASDREEAGGCEGDGIIREPELCAQRSDEGESGHHQDQARALYDPTNLDTLFPFSKRGIFCMVDMEEKQQGGTQNDSKKIQAT